MFLSTLYISLKWNNNLNKHFPGPAAKFTIRIEKLEPVLDSIASPQAVNFLLLLDEGYKSRPLHLHGLPGPVVEGDHEVEKVWFSQVCRRLLFKVCPAYSRRPKKWSIVKFGFPNEIDPNKICQWIWNGEYVWVDPVRSWSYLSITIFDVYYLFTLLHIAYQRPSWYPVTVWVHPSGATQHQPHCRLTLSHTTTGGQQE